MNRILGELSDSEREEALRRFKILTPHMYGDVPLPRLAQDSGYSLRTLRRWKARYLSEGLSGLVRKPRNDRGQHRFPQELVNLIEGLYLKRPRPTVASVHRRACSVAKQNEWPIPSYDVVYGIVRRMEPAMTVLAHEGAKAYKQAHDLLHRWEAERPNELWQADHKHLDVWTLDEKDRPRKPWLTTIIDDHSRAITGYYLHFDDPSALRTALALRQALWHKDDPRWRVFGVPDVFYTDHGSDFISTHMEQVAADIKMQLVFSTVGEPRGRGKIERFFKTVDQMLLRELPAYKEGERPPHGPYLTLPQLDERLREWILDSYHQRVHGGTGERPIERWEAGGFLPRTLDSLDQLNLLLLTEAKPRRVRRDGVHFEGFIYTSPVLAASIGEDVVICYDPRDLAEIHVYHKGQYLCRAVCHELSASTISLKEIRGARNERRRQLRRGISERGSAAGSILDQLHEATGTPGRSPGAVETPSKQLKLYRDE